jgi:predicted Zn-dependent protease
MIRAEVAVRDLDTPDALLEVMRDLTWVHLSAGNDVAARDTLEELLQLAPDDPFALRTAGVMAVRQREWEIAEALFDSYLMFHPDSADAYLMVGNLHLELGPAQAAVEHLEAAVEIDPEMPLAYRSLGIAYERVGRVTDAVQSLHRYLELAVQPGDAVQVRATIAMLRR